MYSILTGTIGTLAGAAACIFAGASTALASDHGDTPLLIGAGRHDARITDLYAFTNEDNLVLVLCTDPAIPPGVTEYKFSSDVEFRILIDNHSAVAFDDPADLDEFGGTIVQPLLVSSDVEIRIRFNPQGKLLIEGAAMPGSTKKLPVFTGLRDDPFIRAPRTGRNVAAIVLEIPLDMVLDDQHTLLIWATSSVRGFDGPIQEHAGRALRSQFPENDLMNSLEPRFQSLVFGAPPDVMVFDTSRPAQYPNGRLLTDDVVDLVGDARVLANDAPFPDANDVPFLSEFPYLAPPHAP